MIALQATGPTVGKLSKNCFWHFSESPAGMVEKLFENYLKMVPRQAQTISLQFSYNLSGEINKPKGTAAEGRHPYFSGKMFLIRKNDTKMVGGLPWTIFRQFLTMSFGTRIPDDYFTIIF